MAGIVGNKLVGPFGAPNGVKLDFEKYLEFLEDHLLAWLDDQPLSSRQEMIFGQDNAPAHVARSTKEGLTEMGFSGSLLMA